ncbi:hypothetical protein E4U02_06105 [Microbacterium paludicola]|uniref:Uncharacterized protein n=1 Tax=Microbacterium paludicola TaxID=300019 RepID=A0A4Y9FXF9_9MICO|nr:hypothetical protein [Microbacterium paludicola]MBF0815976.1 hypothetical protein [Microbacterium paludicola]TFU33299.1 hypothetical protein E4U02_06105 [Microbacterium paludicola]
MDQATATATPAAAAPGGTAEPAERRARSRLTRDLLLLGIVGVLLAAAIWAGFSSLYRLFWGPSAFVERYIGMIADGDAAAALAVPGVALDDTDLEAAGLPITSSDALLRSAALTFELTDVAVTEKPVGDEEIEVTATYAIDGVAGKTTFHVTQVGSDGLTPRWGFATSPLAEIRATVLGSMQFSVNGFEMDKRQVSPDREKADPVAPVSLLVFSPGIYSVEVDTATAETGPVKVLADAALKSVPLEVQAEPTKAFTQVVKEKVSAFLAECSTQQVLQPSGCPFGIQIDDRVFADTIAWSIPSEPNVEIVPDGAYWAISPATGTAHIEADVRSIFNGLIYHYSEDVPFVIDGTVDILSDGTASILVGSPALR